MERLFITALACLMSVSVVGQTAADYPYITFESNDYGFDIISTAEDIFTKKGFIVVNHKSDYPKDLKSNDCLLLKCKINYRRGVTGWTNSVLDLSLIDCNNTIIYQKRSKNTTNFGQPDVLNNFTKATNGIINFTRETNGSQSIDNKKESSLRIRVSEAVTNISNIAVIGKESTLCDGSKDDGQGLAELVEGELLGIYGVVERRHLEEILDEQRLAMSGLLLEDSDFAQAGCLAGAQGTVIASYACLQGKTKLQIKLVDCSTSDLYWSATGFDVSEFELMDALRVELNK